MDGTARIWDVRMATMSTKDLMDEIYSGGCVA